MHIHVGDPFAPFDANLISYPLLDIPGSQTPDHVALHSLGPTDQDIDESADATHPSKQGSHRPHEAAITRVLSLSPGQNHNATAEVPRIPGRPDALSYLANAATNAAVRTDDLGKSTTFARAAETNDQDDLQQEDVQHDEVHADASSQRDDLPSGATGQPGDSCSRDCTALHVDKEFNFTDRSIDPDFDIA